MIDPVPRSQPEKTPLPPIRERFFGKRWGYNKETIVTVYILLEFAFCTYFFVLGFQCTNYQLVLWHFLVLANTIYLVVCQFFRLGPRCTLVHHVLAAILLFITSLLFGALWTMYGCTGGTVLNWPWFFNSVKWTPVPLTISDMTFVIVFGLLFMFFVGLIRALHIKEGVFKYIPSIKPRTARHLITLGH